MATERPFSKLLINESPLQVLPSLAVKVGVNGAMFLQQVHYWITMPKAHERDGRFWVYNSLPDWQEQFPFWSEDTIQRTIAGLEKQGVLLSGNYNNAKFDRTKWYTIDYEALDALEVTPPPRKSKRPSRESASPSPQVAVTTTAKSGEHRRTLRGPIPETNAETTTETNYRERAPRPVDIPTEAVTPRASRDMQSTGRKLTPGVNAPKPTPATPLPQEWAFDPALRQWAIDMRGLTPDQADDEHDSFCAYYLSIAHDRRRGWRSDWLAAEHGWFLKREQFTPPQQKGTRNGSHYQSADERKADSYTQWANIIRAGQADDGPDDERRQGLRLIG